MSPESAANVSDVFLEFFNFKIHGTSYRMLKCISLTLQERSSPVGSSKPFDGPSLLDGNYSEYDAHAEFQAALAEWRGNKATQKQTEKKVTFRPDSAVKAPSKSFCVT